MTSSFFITSTGTGQGKTLVISALSYQLQQAGKEVRTIKPIISGFENNNVAQSDTGIILQSMNKLLSPENIESISPWRFKAPLSPDMAAELEGKQIIFCDLIEFCRKNIDAATGITLIEGAGGVMSPITAKKTNLDLITTLGIPAILVSASYLGCISHILTAITSLQQQQIPVAGLALCEVPHNLLPAETVLPSLKPHLPNSLKMITIKSLETTTRIWETVPDITNLVSDDA